VKSFFEHNGENEFDDTDVKRLIANCNVLDKTYEVFGKYDFSGDEIRLITLDPEWFIQTLEKAIYELTGGSDARIKPNDTGFRMISIVNKNDGRPVRVEVRNGFLEILLGSKEDLNGLGEIIDSEYFDNNVGHLTWNKMKVDDDKLDSKVHDLIYDSLTDYMVNELRKIIVDGDYNNDKRSYYNHLLETIPDLYQILNLEYDRWANDPNLDSDQKKELSLINRKQTRFI